MFERKLILLKHWENCHLFKDPTKMRVWKEGVQVVPVGGSICSAAWEAPPLQD